MTTFLSSPQRDGQGLRDFCKVATKYLPAAIRARHLGRRDPKAAGEVAAVEELRSTPGACFHRILRPRQGSTDFSARCDGGGGRRGRFETPAGTRRTGRGRGKTLSAGFRPPRPGWLGSGRRGTEAERQVRAEKSAEMAPDEGAALCSPEARRIGPRGTDGGETTHFTAESVSVARLTLLFIWAICHADWPCWCRCLGTRGGGFAGRS